MDNAISRIHSIQRFLNLVTAFLYNAFLANARARTLTERVPGCPQGSVRSAPNARGGVNLTLHKRNSTTPSWRINVTFVKKNSHCLLTNPGVTTTAALVETA